MSNLEQNNSFIDLKALSEPVVKLIETISNGIGVIYEPTIMRRKARAENDVAVIKFEGEQKILNLQERTEKRLKSKEMRRQVNIESILSETVKLLPDKVSKDKVDSDWTFNFFENCQDLSDKEVQQIWAKVLAREISKPSSFSLRTVNFLKSMSKTEAQKFSQMSRFVWESVWSRSVVYLVYIPEMNDRLAWYSVFVDIFEHFVSIGILKAVSSFKMGNAYDTLNHPAPKSTVLFYKNQPYRFSILEQKEHASLGYFELTETGRELYKLCDELDDEKLIDIFKKNISEHNLSIEPIENNFVRFP